MILCELYIFQMRDKKTIKLDDSVSGQELIDELSIIYGRKGVLFSKNRAGPVNLSISLYDQGIRNADTLIYVM